MNPTASNSPPATLRPRDLWTLLNVSKSKLYRDDALGLIPKGFAVGASRRWMRDDILAWIEAGTPSASEWEAMRKAAGRKGGAS
jgi:predicted DNA-binding transcriptional regulator AlpA